MSAKTDNPVRREYGRLAADYDQRWAAYVSATVERTLARMRLAPRERLLDAGCGTGTLLARLAEHHVPECLTGLDPTPEMLEVARGVLPSSVTLCGGRMEALPFADASFDAVVSCSAFHYVRRPGDALAEMRRVLRPGGRLWITDWCRDYPTVWVLDRWLRWFNAAHWRTYGARELADMLVRHGFAGVGTERFKIHWFWGLATVEARRE